MSDFSNPRSPEFAKIKHLPCYWCGEGDFLALEETPEEAVCCDVRDCQARTRAWIEELGHESRVGGNDDEIR